MNSGAEEQVGKKSKFSMALIVLGVLMVGGGIMMGFAVGPQGAFFLIGFGVLLGGLLTERFCANASRWVRLRFAGGFEA